MYDSDGNEVTVTGSQGNFIWIKNIKGEIKKVHYNDLNQYTPYPPDVMYAAKRIMEMVKSGELTIDELRKIKEAL